MTAIRRLHALPPDLPTLAAEARAEGYGMLDVLVANWTSGACRFSAAGEALFGGFDDAGGLVAIGGITKDPYAEALRMRRFYVARRARRGGLGATLARAAIAEARAAGAPSIRLRAPAGAFVFWEALGFAPVLGDPQATHQLALTAAP